MGTEKYYINKFHSHKSRRDSYLNKMVRLNSQSSFTRDKHKSMSIVLAKYFQIRSAIMYFIGFIIIFYVILLITQLVEVEVY